MTRIDQQTAIKWRRLYEEGATVEDLALAAGRSTQTVRKALASVGTPMRRVGPRVGTRYNRPAAEPASDSALPRVPKNRLGHRRRGRGI